MTRRQWLFAGAASTLTISAQQRPNVILIMTDDQGWFDLGCYGNPHIRTPNIDALAADGVRFTQFYCSPVCAPTRASLLTGRHYQRTGCVDTYLGRDTLDSSEVTLADTMRAAGYRTGCVGKWHLGRYMRYHPLNRGFDEYFGFWQYGFINRYDDSDEIFDGKTRVEATGYITDVLTDRAIAFVDKHKAEPFFLYLPFNAPHAPHLAPDRYIAPYLKNGLPLGEARIYGMITAIDDNAGRLLRHLDSAGLRENTIVIFMTDNGGVSGYFKAGLRANKGTVYEGGVRVPFIARWPKHIPSGAVVEAMAQHIDVYPTLCELTGVPAPAKAKLDGRSLAGLLRQGSGASPHKYLFHQWNRGRPVMDTVPGDPELKASWAVRDAAGFKLHHNGELYDLTKDPGEERNIAPAHKDKVRELRAEFEQFFSDATSRKYERVPIEIGRADENPVEIDLTWGEASGKVVPQYRRYNSDTIDNWFDLQDSVSWKVDVREPGTYEMILSYGCGPDQENSRVQVQIAGVSAEYTFLPTAGRRVFATRPAARLRLPRGPAILRMKPAAIPGKEMATIHRIWVRRV
jgi:arylsulfatase A-like enzyme